MTDIVERLRGVPKCDRFAFCAFECCCDAEWPEMYIKDAALEIERLRKELAISESFHRVAVAERNAAWQECEQLRATLKGILTLAGLQKDRG